MIEDNLEDSFYVVSVLMTKIDRNNVTSTITQSCRLSNNESEVVRQAIDFALKTKPGFSVDEYLVTKISKSDF